MFTIITHTRFGPKMTTVPGNVARPVACRRAIAAHRQALVEAGNVDPFAARREQISVAVVRFTKPQVGVAA